MTDTSFLQFSSPFIDPKTGMLQRWAHQYLLNPSVSNINVAAGGTFNAPGATVVAHAISLGVPVRPSSGGTGISTGTSGGILGFTSATTVASSALLGANQIVLGGGTGATPATPLGLGSAHVVLHGAAGAPTWSAVDLSADVTGALPTSSLSGTISLTTQVAGVLPVVNGGTNANAPGATAANNIGALAIASNLSDLANAATARASLGLGTIATENANAVAITGGSIDGATVGAITASTGAFTTLAASSTVSGAGFSTYLASPPAIGGSAAAAGAFTTLTATSIALGGGTVLANYVEGTFTPTLVSSGGGAPTYSGQAGTYTRIGNRVLFNLRVAISALNTLAAGGLSVGGLPITSNAGAVAAALSLEPNNLGATAVTCVTASIQAASTSIILNKYAGGADSQLTVADISGTAVFKISGHYQV